MAHTDMMEVTSWTLMWHIESRSLMRGSLHFEEMDVLQMDDDVGIDVADFMHYINTKHHG